MRKQKGKTAFKNRWGEKQPKSIRKKEVNLIDEQNNQNNSNENTSVALPAGSQSSNDEQQNDSSDDDNQDIQPPVFNPEGSEEE